MKYHDMVDEWEAYLRDVEQEELIKNEVQGSIFKVDASDLVKYAPDLVDTLITNPDSCLDAAQEAVDQISAIDKNPGIRIHNLPGDQFTQIRHIRSTDLHSMIETKALIKKTSDVMPKLQKATFECISCGDTYTKEAEDGDEPSSPYKCDCGNQDFTKEENHFKDIQFITLEEIPSTLNNQDQPQQIRCKVSNELVDPDLQQKLTPGNKVEVYAIPVEYEKGRKNDGLYEIELDAHHIEPAEKILSNVDINDDDKEKIHEIADSDNTEERIIDSICPTIKGHRNIKRAISYQMFGGVHKTREDGTQTRGDIHLLAIGEPGTGKSQLLQFVEKTSPKGRYAVGNSTTKAGVTATVVREEKTNEWSLEAGLLPLAHNGIACIDEIDKMEEEERSSMHEALEQGTISVHKANIQATLNAQASVLAAGNPKYGRFDEYKDISEQIEISDTLISRFDLIFPVKDEPDKEQDRELAQHMTKIHSSNDSEMQGFSQDLLRKYIAYARKNFNPTLGEDAQEKLQTFFVDVRQQGQEGEGDSKIPITARQMEALIRLSEAAARLELSDTVEKHHAEKAIDMLTTSLEEIGVIGDDGTWDVDKKEAGMSSESRNSRQQLSRAYDRVNDDTDGNTVIVEDLIEELEDKTSMEEPEIEELISRAKEDGDYFEPKSGELKKL